MKDELGGKIMTYITAFRLKNKVIWQMIIMKIKKQKT